MIRFACIFMTMTIVVIAYLQVYTESKNNNYGQV